MQDLQSGPLRILLAKPRDSNSKFAKSALLCPRPYDITFVSRKAIKGQVLAEYMADHSILGASKLLLKVIIMNCELIISLKGIIKKSEKRFMEKIKILRGEIREERCAKYQEELV